MTIRAWRGGDCAPSRAFVLIDVHGGDNRWQHDAQLPHRLMHAP